MNSVAIAIESMSLAIIVILIIAYNIRKKTSGISEKPLELMMYLMAPCLIFDMMLYGDIIHSKFAFDTICILMYFLNWIMSVIVYNKMIVMMSRHVSINKRRLMMPVICIGVIAVIVYAVCSYCGWIYTGNVVKGFETLFSVVSIVPIVFGIVISLMHIKVVKYGISVLWPVAALIPVIAILFQGELHSALLYPAVTISVLMIYITVSLEEELRSAKVENELAISKNKVLVSRIQPHFIFNTLSTIQSLYHRDVKTADRIMKDFAEYLRLYINLADMETMIPISKEIENLKHYTDIEMVRFENIRVEYDIRVRDVLIPYMTIQPLVENSIKHGVRAVRDGIVHVSAYEEDGHLFIEVKDNGVGFDVNAPKHDNDTHVGMDYVRKRVEGAGGTFRISSTPGQGTIAGIVFPMAR